MKLQLFIAHNGGVSRRKAFDHVLAGDVTVNGMVIREPSQMIEPNEDKIVLLGREIEPKGYEYIMLYKPAGYVTTCEAQFDQRAVMSLLPEELRYLKPVGRLDKETQGLLLLTNDGEMANRLAHPSFDVNKTYHARVARRMEFREKDRLEQGVVIEGFKTAPAQVSNLNFHGDFTEFDLTIHEGHKRQVRLMCHEVGHDVISLTRIVQGPLKLDLLKAGTWRHLTQEEVAQLKVIGRKASRSDKDFRMMRPMFSSNAQLRRSSATHDWHSADTKNDRREPSRGGRDEKPRREFSREGRDARPRRDAVAGGRERPRRDEAPRGERSAYEGRSERPSFGPRREVRRDAVAGDRPWSAPRRDDKNKKPFGGKPSGAKPFGRSSSGGKPAGSKPFGNKPFGKKSFGKKPFGRSSSGPRSFSRPSH